MSEAINANYTWNSDEAVTAHEANNRHKFRKPFRYASYVIAFLFMLGSIYKVVVAGWSFFSVVVFLGGIYWLFLRRYGQAWAVRRKFKKRPDKNATISWTITEDEINSSAGELGESSASWASVLKVVHASKGFLLYPTEELYYWIPHSSFRSESDISRMAHIAKDKVAKFIELG